MLAQPSSLDPSEPPFDERPLSSAPSGSKQVPPWLVGFHGAVSTSSWLDSDEVESPSFRSIALARRSLGIESLKTLTDLPSRGSRRSPSSSNGARPVGADPHPAVGATRSAEWSGEEQLATYLDQRLLDAKVLYLPNRGRAYACFKRLLDLVGAAILLVVSSPVMLVLAWLIRRDSPGPAIFAQQRVTRGGRIFTFFKFRTMWVDARQRYPALYDYADVAGNSDVYYKLEDDPRSTNVGRWLRRTTLDELPNLFNVLRGDMSLVGPRPELPDLIPLYRPEDLALFFTKAGLTGLAQVAGRSLLTVRERISLDLRYVANQTLLLDIRILIRTVSAVLLRRGAF